MEMEKFQKWKKKIKRRKDEKKTSSIGIVFSLEIIGEVKMDQNGKSMGVEMKLLWKWFGNGLDLEMVWKWSWLMASTRVEMAKTAKRQNDKTATKSAPLLSIL
jgi:hypothetical protein